MCVSLHNFILYATTFFFFLCVCVVNLQERCRVLNLEFLPAFCCVFCTFVTDTKVKEPHEMPMITFDVSDRFVFLLARPLSSHRSFFLKGGKYKDQQVHKEGESSHAAIANKRTFQKVTGGIYRLHLMYVNMKLKVTMYFFLIKIDSPNFRVRQQLYYLPLPRLSVCVCVCVFARARACLYVCMCVCV